MNPMQHDLHDLGLALWPDNTPLWPNKPGTREPAWRPYSGLIAAAVGVATLLVVLGIVVLGLVVLHKQGPRSTLSSVPPVTTASPSPSVTRVEVSVPENPLTFEVASGTTIALHLHLTSYRSQSAWSVGTASGPGVDFQPVQVPYPGAHPASSGFDFYVAFRIASIGTTQIDIGIPITCPISASCPNQFQQFNIRAVAAPMHTGTVTGVITQQCATTGCLAPARNTLITFRNTHGQTITTRTDAAGDYFAELSPGTWRTRVAPRGHTRLNDRLRNRRTGRHSNRERPTPSALTRLACSRSCCGCPSHCSSRLRITPRPAARSSASTIPRSSSPNSRRRRPWLCSKPTSTPSAPTTTNTARIVHHTRSTHVSKPDRRLATGATPVRPDAFTQGHAAAVAAPSRIHPEESGPSQGRTHR